MSLAPERTEVLIVGAGPVGLALAIELGSRGIACVVVEQRREVIDHPRAKLVNVRSTEHLRRWGIADTLRRAAPLAAEHARDVVFATRMTGYRLASFEYSYECGAPRDERYAEPAQWVPQDTVERVLRDHASSLPSVVLRLGWRFEGAEPRADDVDALLVQCDSSRPATVRASYVVGADGARSMVRELIGVAMEGRHAFSLNLNVLFRAPGLRTLHRFGPAVQYWLVNPQTPSIVGPLDDVDRWYLVGARLGSGAEPDPDAVRSLVQQAIGADAEVEIVGIDPWAAHELIATRYRRDRMLLVGDACHLHPPFGGFGMNLGIADAVDLGWKLAATLRGWGGAALLDSYQSERQPVHRWAIDEACHNFESASDRFLDPDLETDGPAGERARKRIGEAIATEKQREIRTLGIVLGYRYHGSPIVAREHGEPPPQDPMAYRPSAYPGCRAPHLWLRDGSSLYDRFGRDFTLLVTDPEAMGEADEMMRTTGRTPVALAAPNHPELRDLYSARFALIRPDQHVCWRGDRLPADPERLLSRVTGHTSES